MDIDSFVVLVKKEYISEDIAKDCLLFSCFCVFILNVFVFLIYSMFCISHLLNGKTRLSFML